MIKDWHDPQYCLVAVKENGHTLEYVKERTPEICLQAVKRHGLALRFVKNQTPTIIHHLKKYNMQLYEFYKKENRITIPDNEMVEFYNDNPHLLLTL